MAAPPDLELGVAPLSPPAPIQLPLLGLGVGLNLNIQKTKIMASGPITSWQIDGETIETVRDIIFGGPKSLYMVTAALKLKDVCCLEESYDQPRQHIRSLESLDGPCRSMAEKSYPLPKVRGSGREEQPTSKEQWLCGRRRAERSYSTFKVRSGGGEEIPLIQGKVQRLRFAGAAVKRYPTAT